MRVPRPTGWTGAVAVLLLAGSGAGAGAFPAKDRGPQVAARIPLETIGLTGFSPAQLSAGASLLTVHFLDDTHLLVTFGTHGLVRRVEGDPKEDEDRMMAAEIVELPSGRVLDKSEWQAHDHGRYLWNIGHGRFLVRIGNVMEMMAPLERLGQAHPLERTRVNGMRRPSLLLVSPDRNVLTMETMVRLAKAQTQLGDVPQENAPVTTLVEFVRLRGGEGEPFGLDVSGRVMTPQPLFVPLNGDGVLYAEPHGKRGRWMVEFSPFGGKPGEKPLKVAEMDSGCDPQLALVSRSEFVAVTCRMGTEASVLKAYAFDGHEAWEEPMSGVDDPVYVTAPAAGRFALLRKIEGGPGDVQSGMPASATRQELRVYQTESGDLLLKADLNPYFRTAENFDLSIDGTLALAVQGKVINVYKLPLPDAQDRKDMELAGKSAPPLVGAGPVTLPGVVETASAEPGGVGAERPVVAARAPASAAAGAPMSAGAAKKTEVAAGGEASAGVRRTPPTLLKPGEKPEFGKANPQPAAGAGDEGPR